MKKPPSLGKKRKKLLPFHCQARYYSGTSWSVLNKTFDPNDTATGQENPRWEEKIEAGLDAGSAYSRSYAIKVLSPGIGSVTWTQWKDNRKKSYFTYMFTGCIGLWSMNTDFSAFGTPDMLAAQRQATIAFLGKIRENNTPFQAMPFLGELRETIGMLKNPFKGILRHTAAYRNSVRRLRRTMTGKSAGHIADAIADAYLQWTYGVKPLFNDVESIMAAAKDLLAKDPEDVPLRVSVKAEAMGPGSMTFGPSSTTKIAWGHLRTSWIKVQIKGALKSDVSHPLESRAQVKTGLILSEFIPTAWELLPYSFLVDYVTNIGDLLGAAATSTAALRWYWMSTKTTKRITNVGVPLPTTGLPRTVRGSVAPAIIERMTFNRSRPALSVSLRDFRFQLPNFGQQINTLVLGFAAARR